MVISIVTYFWLVIFIVTSRKEDTNGVNGLDENSSVINEVDVIVGKKPNDSTRFSIQFYL